MIAQATRNATAPVKIPTRTELRLHTITNIPDATHKVRAKQASTTGRKRRAVKLVTSPSKAHSPKAICATDCTFWPLDCEADRRLIPLWSPVHTAPRSSSRATARTRRRTMGRGGMRRGLYRGAGIRAKARPADCGGVQRDRVLHREGGRGAHQLPARGGAVVSAAGRAVPFQLRHHLRLAQPQRTILVAL